MKNKIQFERNQREGLHFIHVEHLHDRINSLRGDVCVHKTSSNLPLFIIVHVQRQESEQSCICICAMSINFESVSTLILLGFGTVTTIFNFHFFT